MEREQQEKKTLADECLAESKKLFFDNKLKKAVLLGNRAADLYKEIEDRVCYARTLNVLGVILDSLGNVEQSGDCYIEGLDIALELEDEELISIFYNNIGSQFQDYGEDERAMEYFQLALDHSDLNPSDEHGMRLLMTLYENLAEITAKCGRIEEACDFLEKARSFMPEHADVGWDFSFEAIESRIFWLCGKEDLIRKRIPQLVETTIENENCVDFRENIRDVCEVLRMAGEFDQLKRVIEHSERTCASEDIYRQLTNLEMWIDYYKTTGDREQYLAKCEEYYKLMDWKKSIDGKERTDMLEAKIELRKAEHEKNRVDSISKIDSLTGIGNRTKMLEDSVDLINESIRSQTAIGIGLLDIDFFKECNDTYGHIEGDACLAKVANILEEVLDGEGAVYRFGGDEFLVLIPHAPEPEAFEAIGKEIKDKLEAAAIPNENSPISDVVTISQGYTRAIAEEGDTIERLVDLADRVLYRVKRRGRNGYHFTKISQLMQENPE